MPSNCLILCHPILLLHSIFPSIKVFSFSCQDPHNYFVIEIQKNIGKYSLMDSLVSLSLLSKLTQPLLLER